MNFIDQYILISSVHIVIYFNLFIIDYKHNKPFQIISQYQLTIW